MRATGRFVPDIVCEVDHAHPAATELPLDGVAAGERVAEAWGEVNPGGCHGEP